MQLWGGTSAPHLPVQRFDGTPTASRSGVVQRFDRK